MADTFKLNNGIQIPQVLIGMYLVPGNEVYAVLDAAFAAGYRGIDTAEVYRNEAEIGKALNEGGLLKKYGLKREDIFITSKAAPYSHGRGPATLALSRTLSALQTSYVDLYLIHWPGIQGRPSHDSSVADTRFETWQALEEGYQQGKIKAIGISNYLIPHMEDLISKAKIKPSVLQIEHHPLLNQREIVSYCQQQGIHYQAYSSLGSMKACHELLNHPVILAVAKEVGKLPSQVLLKWAVQQGISVLPKSCNPQHIAENIQLFDWKLSDEHMRAIHGLDQGKHFCWDPASVQ